MNCEVVVVGGGIGGLTVAALLAQRGVDVCLLERASQVGGCAASFEKLGYNFEQGYGLFSGWKPGEIHDRVFSELPVDPPEVRRWEPSYTVRLPDGAEIALAGDTEAFENTLSKHFPECAANAISFYRKLESIGSTLRKAFQKNPELLSASTSRRTFSLLKQGRIGVEILRAKEQSTLQQLEGLSPRFRRFIDVQLRALTQATSADVSYLQAALALSETRTGMFALRGGGAGLAESLADSIKRSGGRIRLDTPALRLSYDSTNAAVGVDLLSGETVQASKAIVSNLTVWDTYGKLVGLNRTPSEIRKQMNAQRSWGAYLLYLALDESAAQRLTSEHVIALTDWREQTDYDPTDSQFLFAAAPAWDARAPDVKRAVTVHTFTEAEDWFTFHQDETELETKDQQTLERIWEQLHMAMPELGSGIEVIDTATPRSFYDLTRRKLGMVGGLIPSADQFWTGRSDHETFLPNLFIVSDTVCPGSIEGLTRSALLLANRLCGKRLN